MIEVIIVTCLIVGITPLLYGFFNNGIWPVEESYMCVSTQKIKLMGKWFIEEAKFRNINNRDDIIEVKGSLLNGNKFKVGDSYSKSEIKNK